MEIITNFLYQLLFTVGVIIAFGFLIAFSRRMFCSLLGRAGHNTLLATGFIGTPIHELSHALMCLIFGHKIVEIKLFQLHSDDGTLGYVNHSYNPRNIYQQIGNFFIGIAPIVFGSGFLFLFMYLLIPETFSVVFSKIQSFTGSLADESSLSKILGLFGSIIVSIFDFSNAGNFLWWLYLVLALMISSHMELSGADIKGSVVGLLVLAGIILVIDVITGLISTTALSAITGVMASFGMTIASFLLISLVFCLLLILIALVIKLIGKLLGR